MPRFAEAHVVGQNRAPASQQECDALNLMGKQPIGQRAGVPERGGGGDGGAQALDYLLDIVMHLAVRSRAGYLAGLSVESCLPFERIEKAGIYAEVLDDGCVGGRDGGRRRR